MEFTNEMPVPYERFALRRLFWQESGLHYDDMPHGEVMEATLFRQLEQEHPHRFKRAERDAGRKH